MTLEKITKIVIAIFIVFVTFGLTSCVTKKKLKESQELATTHILDVTDIRLSNLKNTLKSEITETVNKDFSEKFKQQKETISNNENESLEVIGTLPNSDKETSVTVGNTTIKNNGGNVSFDIKASKQLNSQLETINKELTQSLNEERNARISLENEINEFKTAQLKVNEDLKSKLDMKIKETNKIGINFWYIFIPVLLVLAFLVYRFKKFFYI